MELFATATTENQAPCNSGLRQAINDHLAVVRQLEEQEHVLKTIATRMVRAIETGSKVLW